ncbi:MAG TPA: hypothetical protein VL563_01105 [Gemmatimonadales bacterium]|jgi:hypothetical protein|nr:hypothetical protein [Gemmatimonadales bacterium]
MTDARREAVARMLHDASPTPEIHAATHWKGLNPSYRAHWYEMADALLAWHDAETRALREAVTRLLDKVEAVKSGLASDNDEKWRWDLVDRGAMTSLIETAAMISVLLTPTPGAGGHEG